MPTRREILTATTAIAIGTAGCLEDGISRSQFNQLDEFPEDDRVNRQCEINAENTIGGEIDRFERVFSPFIYDMGGRDDLVGNNQTYEIEVEADREINIFVVDSEYKDELIEVERERVLNGQSISETDNTEYPHETTIVATNERDANLEKTIFNPEKTISLIATPNSYEDITDDPIEVVIETKCKYHLSYEEYQERRE